MTQLLHGVTDDQASVLVVLVAGMTQKLKCY